MTARERYTFDVKAAAEYLGVAPTTLYGIVARGEIDCLRTRGNVATCVRAGKSIRLSGRVKFSEAGLDAWIAAHRAPVRHAEVAPAIVRKPEPLPMPAARRFAR